MVQLGAGVNLGCNISITSDIYRNFEKHGKMCAVFLDISEASDVWQDGLIHQLESNDLAGNFEST